MFPYLQANIISLSIFDNLWYVETTAKLQPSSDTQTQSITLCSIQTHLFQLPVPAKSLRKYKKRIVTNTKWGKVKLWWYPVENKCPCCTHRDLLGVSMSYSTWCLSGMRGLMASNSGRRFGSLITSFRSPTSTGKSIDLGKWEEKSSTIRQSTLSFASGKIYLSRLVNFSLVNFCFFEAMKTYKWCVLMLPLRAFYVFDSSALWCFLCKE